MCVDGELVAEPSDVTATCWRADLVGFLIGCSFTFEGALLGGRGAGAARRAGRQRADVPHVAALPAGGPVTGPLVVSMRPVPGRTWSPTAVAGDGALSRPCTVRRCTSATPRSSASPTSTPPTTAIPVAREPGDVPVFWACGVTPQAAVMESRPPFAITHAPGHMLITDVRDATYRV